MPIQLRISIEYGVNIRNIDPTNTIETVLNVYTLIKIYQVAVKLFEIHLNMRNERQQDV